MNDDQNSNTKPSLPMFTEFNNFTTNDFAAVSTKDDESDSDFDR
jgi:hypothetical protein